METKKVANVIWNSERVAEALAVTRKERPGLLALLKELLDDYHSIQRSELYYDLIAGDWLDKFLHVSFVAWENILSGRSMEGHHPIQVPEDTFAFTLLSVKPEFHDYWQAMSQRLLAGESPEEWIFANKEINYSTSVKQDWRKKIIVNFLGSKRPSVVLCCPYVIRSSSREWMTALWKWRSWARWDDFNYPLELFCEIDQSWRLKRSMDNTPVEGFSGLLRALLPLHIPAALLEGYLLLRSKALGLKLWRPQALYTANALQGNFLFKMLGAEWRMEGTKILGHQHGGNYGMEPTHALEDYETGVTDRFYSWGWKRNDRPVVPLSPPYPKQYRRKRHRILLMCGINPPAVHRIHYQPLPGTIETMFKDTGDFLSVLPENDALLVRLNKVARGFNQKDLYLSCAPWINFDNNNLNAYIRYAESRLVVHNYIGTTILETLALDIPTVCFFDPGTYVFRDELQSHISALEKVGILHRSGIGAGHFVKSVMDDPQAWWQKPDVQNAYKLFARNYANFSPDWTSQWEEEFRQFIK
jgi:putative transferase (TIGR04331 family)